MFLRKNFYSDRCALQRYNATFGDLANPMWIIGEGEEFFVAAAVAIGGEVVGAAVGIEGKDAFHLLLTIAVLREEATREAAVEDFYPGAEDGDVGEEGLHPVVDRRADDEHVGSLVKGL